jgi:hypothetical protein
MLKYFSAFLFSITTLAFVEFKDTDTPIGAGAYLGERYRMSKMEPYAEIKSTFNITESGYVEQNLILKDDSLESNAVFHFSGKLYACTEFHCEYMSSGRVIAKPKIQKNLFGSRFISLLTEGVNEHHNDVEILYKSKGLLFVNIHNKDDSRYNIYIKKE